VSFLCLDYGAKRIGVAVAEPPAYVAVPLATYKAEPFAALVESLRRYADERSVEQLVIGLPLQTDGREGSTAQAARAFGDELSSALSLPVDYYDERMTSVAAESALPRRQRKRHVDAVAAALILEGYLRRTGRVQ
jgi:putative Holliday junction resolvase